MPRIRVRTTPGGERVVGTRNCSTLTITLVAYAQRSTLQLRADAKLFGGEATLEHWVWEFPELQQPTHIELVSEPGHTFDPPDKSEMASAITPVPAQPEATEIRAIEEELKHAEASLRKIRYLKAHESCSFCGRGKDQVSHMIAGPSGMICDACIGACSELLSRPHDDV